MVQYRLEVCTASHPAHAIVLERGGVDVELLRQKCDGAQWSRMELHRTKTEIAHGIKLERHAQAVWVVPACLKKGIILRRESEIGNQVPVRNVIWEACQSFPLLGGQKGTRHSVASFVIKKGGWRRVNFSPRNQGLFRGYCSAWGSSMSREE